LEHSLKNEKEDAQRDPADAGDLAEATEKLAFHVTSIPQMRSGSPGGGSLE
jgi:hypothetical protein